MAPLPAGAPPPWPPKRLPFAPSGAPGLGLNFNSSRVTLGDGGKAVDAELSDVSDIAFSPRGNLYLADGPRVREVNRSGIITTVAGNGGSAGVVREKPVLIKNGTRALAAPLGDANGLSIAFNTSGELYIGTNNQLLRLTRSGRLDTVPAVVRAGPQRGKTLNQFNDVAASASGDIYSSCGWQGWAIWLTTPGGRAGFVAYARRSGGNCSVLQRGPGGAVYGELGPDLLRLTGHDYKVRYESTANYRVRYRFPEGFFLTYFAFGPRGIVYADEIPGNMGFEARQKLVEVRHGRLAVLWQEGGAAA